ncbi:MAG: hypothetical protein IJ493_10100 [Clostridia bacterium]|nr:hypothetical protein [Clostridia bacterium]
MNAKKLTCLFLLTALLLTSCGGTSTGTDTTADMAEGTGTTTTTEEKEYEFAEFDGYEFRILNADDIYSMHARIEAEETNGETLNDIQYERCRTLEEKMGITIAETNMGVDNDVANHASQVVMAGEDAYDIMYIPARDLKKFTGEGYLYNLLDFDEFNFDEAWWLQNYNEPSTLNGKLYAAASYSQLMIIDSVWCVYYNESIGETLKLDTPYSLAKEGKWTLDVMQTYLKTAGNLNGDDSFTWNADGKAFYGIALGGPSYLITGADELYVENIDGELTYTAGSDRFYNVVSKVTQVLNKNDGSVMYKTSNVSDDTSGHYIYTFEHERSLMMVAELAKTNRMRDKNYSFGILPTPKYDENQENYISVPFYGTPCLTIPVTVDNPERAAAISDALAYLSYEMVWPVFRKVTLEQKNLRNKESIEMLDVIIKSVVPQLSTIYGISTGASDVAAVSARGDDSVASVIASYKEAAQTQIDKINKGE